MRSTKRFWFAMVIAVFVLGCIVACGPSPTGHVANCSAPVKITSASVSGGVTLKKDCYVATDNVEVSGGTLTLDPGVVIQFPNHTAFSILASGRLKAVGTAADPIVLEGTAKTPGYWMGLEFTDSKSADNDLEYVTIKNGGSGPWTGDPISAAGLFVHGNSLVKMSHGTIKGSPAAGFIASAELDIDHSTVTANEFPGWVHPVYTGHIDPSNKLTGNTHDEIRIEDSNDMGLDTTWHALDVPYYVMDWFTVSSKSTFTIDPGVTIRMGNNQYIEVTPGSRLVVNGTAAKRVTITGGQDVPGYYEGIQFSSAANEIHYATISDGGSEPNYANAELYLDNSAKATLTLDHVTISNSSGWGISVDTDTHLTGCPTVTFSNNAKGNVEGDKNATDCP